MFFRDHYMELGSECAPELDSSDPAPQLDAIWGDALKPFRAVPRQAFGFKIVLRVVEDPAANVAANKP
jgi:hypothetical protein